MPVVAQMLDEAREKRGWPSAQGEQGKDPNVWRDPAQLQDGRTMKRFSEMFAVQKQEVRAHGQIADIEVISQLPRHEATILQHGGH